MKSSSGRLMMGLAVVLCLLAGCGTMPDGSSLMPPTTMSTQSVQSLAAVDGTAGSGTEASEVTAPPAVARSATVLIIRWQSTGGSCANEYTLVPRLVVYADGWVIRTDPAGLGQYCEPIPTFRTGQVDLAAVRSRVEEYLADPISAVDISHAPNVADGGLTVLEYTAADGSHRIVTADAIDVRTDQSVDEQGEGRRALAATIAEVDELTPVATEWTPTTAVVVRPAEWVPRYSSEDAPPWPVPVTPGVRELLDGAEGSCASVSGSAAAKLLTAARARTTAAGTWTIDGKPTFVAIGAVLDGTAPCR